MKHPYDIFRCIKLHENLTYSRCVINQKDALAFYGEDASKFNSCPCEKGIEIKRQMGGEIIMRGTCNNCKRPDMAIQKRGDRGFLCASCGAAISGLSPSDAVKALAEKKEKYAGKGKMRGPTKQAKVEEKGKTDPESGAIDASAGPRSTPKMEAKQKPDASIIICFNNGDEKLLSDLHAAAKRNRREPDQHILFLIEQAMTTGEQYDTDAT